MKALLIWPVLPNPFWSLRETLNLPGLQAYTPPMALISLAAFLPPEWDLRLVDRNVRFESEQDWNWCDVVIISAMADQKADFQTLIQKGIAFRKKVAVSGPFPTSVPEFALESGAQYLILGEGGGTVPLFVKALQRKEQKGIFRALEKSTKTLISVPRFDLLDLNAYITMMVKFSRGCPFQYEFCDVKNWFDRQPQTKTTEQLLAELETLYQLGWRRSIFLVDDSFIRNKQRAKAFLRVLIPWMQARSYPFNFLSETSLSFEEDEELVDLMAKAGITMNFMAI